MVDAPHVFGGILALLASCFLGAFPLLHTQYNTPGVTKVLQIRAVFQVFFDFFKFFWIFLQKNSAKSPHAEKRATKERSEMALAPFRMGICKFFWGEENGQRGET